MFLLHSTANFPEHVVEHLPSEIQTGIYFGWAKVDDGPTHKMVMSIGWNPYYKNEKKSMVSFYISSLLFSFNIYF